MCDLSPTVGSNGRSGRGLSEADRSADMDVEPVVEPIVEPIEKSQLSPSVRPIVGYVLAGGRSQRMGIDKSQIEIDGRTALVRQVDLLRQFCGDKVVVVGSEVSGLDRDIPVIPDRNGREGPLDGLITALNHAADIAVSTGANDGPTFGALIVAVDLWSITAVEINTLIDVFHDPTVGPFTDVVHLQGSRVQPLGAVWRITESLQHLSRAFDQGERSVVRAWEGLRRSAVMVSESVLANINTPEDVAHWKASNQA